MYKRKKLGLSNTLSNIQKHLAINQLKTYTIAQTHFQALAAHITLTRVAS